MSPTLRPLRRDETNAARALWSRSAPHDPLTPALFDEKVWGEPAGLALAAELDGDLAGIGVGVLWPGAERRGSIRLLAVAPGARRHGIGAALVSALAHDLRQQGATVLRIGESAPNYLTPGVDVRYDAAPAFFDALGFDPIGEAVNLGVDLSDDDWRTDADESRLADANVEVRRAAASDRDALGVLLDAHWPSWRAETDRALANAPPTLHLALRDGSVLGFAAHSANNVGSGWFGPMGTSPDARGLGIGATLLRRCLADLRAAGLGRATIAWAAALPFYERACGATVERRFRRLERAL